MTIHASTVLSRSPNAILSHISRISRTYPNHPLLFALSPNVHSQDLTKLVKGLTSFSSQTIGCLSAPLPGHIPQALISCSLAVFNPEQAVLFRSVIPGRRISQVGRWHAFRKKDDIPSTAEGQNELESINWGDVWDGNMGDNALPPHLRNLNPTDINEVIFFSDSSPEGLNSSLVALSTATKLGLIATSTPFITGRPVTLFHNQHIHDSGAVGIALKKTSQSQKSTAQSEFIGLIPLSTPMKVTQCEGNMINTLDRSNPAQLLLDAIHKSGIDSVTHSSFKEGKNFALGTIKDGKLNQIFSITAGDPSRGNISLESQNAPIVGTEVQFFHHPNSQFEIPQRFYSSSAKAVAFLTSPELSLEPNDSELEEFTQILPNTFLASSENGFVMSRSGDEAGSTWGCTVPGGLVSLEWP